MRMVEQLSGAMIYDPGNVPTNEKLWDAYASEWSPDADFVKKMTSRRVGVLGDEWAPRDETERVFKEWMEPYCKAQSSVLEIGSGGGRVAKLVSGKCGRLALYDVSSKMLETARKVVGPAASYHLKEYPDGPFDFIICFDVMVHMDLHTTFSTLRKIKTLLSPQGRAFVSTANLATKDGWERFSKQERASVGGFCFCTPETVRVLVSKAGLRIVEEQAYDDTNTYYRRDYLVLLTHS